MLTLSYLSRKFHTKCKCALYRMKNRDSEINLSKLKLTLPIPLESNNKPL